MATIHTETYELPQHWACPLINDDYSGLEDEEIDQIDEFIAAMTCCYHEFYCVGVDHDGHFAHWHDATVYGVKSCTVSTFTFHTR